MKRILSLVLTVALILSAVPLSPFAVSATAEQVFVLPTGLQEIEEQAFAGNTSITTLVVPNGVTSIGSEAFEGCNGLTEVSIASRNVSIANDAFKNCSREIVFYAHNGSTAMLWAMAHGYKCVSLDDDSDHLTRFSAMISHSGFDPSLLMSNTFASKCLIVRTPGSMDRLPDISAYNPIDIFRSDDHLYYIQFDTEANTEDCFGHLNGNSGIKVEPDRIGASDDVSAQSVTIAENWGTNDTMGFDVYAPFVAQHSSGSVTIAVIDSGVSESSWGGSFSNSAISFVGGSAYSDSARHGSKVASIINDCVGSNKSKITLLPIKVVNSSSMYRTSVIIEGIKHAYSHGANIINMSLGWDSSEGTSPEIEHQLSVASSKGILIVAAAGNGSGNVMYPASCGGVLAVSALAYSSAAGYSVRSRTGAIDYTAPGMHLRTSSYDPIDGAGDILGTASTSFAAPQITAALALIKLDSTHSGSATSVLNSCCIEPEGVSSSAYGQGLPQVDRLARIGATDIVLSNMDGDSIPSRLWLADTGNDFMLTWEVLPDNASDKTITVTSSKTSVISVRKYGNSYALISAKGTGEAVVSVSNGEITKEINITVEKPVTEILITGTDGTMIVGKELDLAISVLAEDANNRAVRWRSSNENVLSVSDTGHLIAHTAGKVTITCEALDGYGTKGQVEIEVVEVPDATDISLSAEEKDVSGGQVTMEVGETLTLIPEILPAEAPQECRYSPFPMGIVTVTDDGIVEAVAPGKATIVATATTGQNVYTGLSVTVVIYPTSVNISADKTILTPDESILLSAEVLPDNATDDTVTWISKNDAVATVNSQTGLVTAKGPGTAEIACKTVNGIEDSITIRVYQPITITYDAMGGKCNEQSRIAYSGVPIGRTPGYPVNNMPSATRDYWTFDGWYTAASGGTKVFANTVFTEDTTLYAHWTGLPYTVTFDANHADAICETASMSARVGAKIGTLPTATRENYACTGWYLTATGEESGRITADYIQNNNSNLKLYAHWTPNPYTIKFNANGGKCDTAVMTGTVDTPIGTLPEATRDYYLFDGWFTSLEGEAQITESFTKSTVSEVTVYAHWTPMTYVMTFNANGGSCNEIARTCVVDAAIGEPPVPTRPYYDFNGWYTNDEDSIPVTASYQHDTNEAITVYAYWVPHEYTIIFDPNDGNCDVESIVGKVDIPIGSLPVPTKKYYNWDGWYTAKIGGTIVDENYPHPTDADITVYAHWTPHTYTMTFEVNSEGVVCNPTTKQGTVDMAIGNLPVPTKPNYTLNGWFTAAVGGEEITSVYVHHTDEPITVYAQWRPGTYRITFDANGGTCATTSMTGTVDAEIGSVPKPTRELYEFIGWYTADGTAITQSYIQGTTNNITAIARWQVKTFTLRFNFNDSNTSPANRDAFGLTTRNYPAAGALGALPEPKRNYYTFDAWYTSATGGTKVTASSTHNSMQTLDVYAHWIPHTFTLQFNPNGGNGSTTTRQCNVETAIGTLPTPTRNFYKFLSWNTKIDGTGDTVTASRTYLTESTVTIYAQWQLKPESGWVTEDKVPSGAQITATSWSYREDIDTTESSKSGWTQYDSYWKQTGTESRDYATFPSTYPTTFPSSNADNAGKATLRSTMSAGAYTASNDGATKVVVTNAHGGWIYWHWMYKTVYASGTGRTISDRTGTWNPSGGTTGSNAYAYNYFYEIKSTVDCKYLDTYYCCSRVQKSYNCKSIIPSGANTSNTSGLGTDRFFRIEYFTSTKTVSQMRYKYYRNVNNSTTDPGNGANISNKIKYVKYREK